MNRRPSPLFALVCVLFLLGAQLGAYAHWLGHVSVAVHAASSSGHSDDSGDAKSHACPTCVAFAGLASAPPAFIPPIALAPAATIFVTRAASSFIPESSPAPYTARAPPAVL